jgi:uncharacterized protein
MTAPVPRSDVPCAGCTACCRGMLIILHPEMGDKPEDYLTKEAVHPVTGEPCLALLQRTDGTCIYLGIKGCTIHKTAPIICREFDCRIWFRDWNAVSRQVKRRVARVDPKVLDNPVLDAGRARFDTLPEDQKVPPEEPMPTLRALT